MTRALVRFERPSTGDDWTPVAVFLASPDRLQGRAMPGPAREAWLADLLSRPEPPDVDTEDGPVPGTWEDWVDGSGAGSQDRASIGGSPTVKSDPPHGGPRAGARPGHRLRDRSVRLLLSRY
jgi:hypothetical protein